MFVPAINLKREFCAGLRPEATVRTRAPVVVETFDTYTGRIANPEQAPPPGPLVTGPLAVEGCAAGDLLAIDILDISCRSIGVTTVRAQGGLCPGIAESTEIRLHHVEDDRLYLPAGFTSQPRPMIGTIGVAPPGLAVAANTPGRHGGNLDCPDVGRGATLYLRANLDGALLSLGDVHARQGQGEFCGSAVEIGAEVKLEVQVFKGQGYLASWPILQTQQELAVLCSAPTLEEAARTAVRRTVSLLAGARHCSEVDAYVVLTQLADARICQVVNPAFTVGCYVSREHLSIDDLLANGDVLECLQKESGLGYHRW